MWWSFRSLPLDVGGTPLPYSMGQIDNDDADPTPIEPEALANFIDRPPTSFCGQRKGLFRWKVKRSGKEVTDAVNRIAPIGDVHTITAVERGLRAEHYASNMWAARALMSWMVATITANSLVVYAVECGLYNDGEDKQVGPQRAGIFVEAALDTGSVCANTALWKWRAENVDFDQILRHYYRGSMLKKAW